MGIISKETVEGFEYQEKHRERLRLRERRVKAVAEALMRYLPGHPDIYYELCAKAIETLPYGPEWPGWNDDYKG